MTAPFEQRSAELEAARAEIECLRCENQRLRSERNAELEQFVYIASHDLQAPLRHMVAFVGLLEEELDDGVAGGDAGEYIQFIKSGASRMQLLIRDLLAYSRAGNARLVRDEVDLDDLVDEVATVIKTDNPDVDFELLAGGLPSIRANRCQTGQLLQNLLQNAVRHSRPGGSPRIRVAVDEFDDRWVLHVEDDGVGIAPADQARIFEPFCQLGDGSRGGTGIGLAICARVARRHGGDISVTSRPGHGSTFHVSIARPSAEAAGYGGTPKDS